jgi:hypothetical protein
LSKHLFSTLIDMFVAKIFALSIAPEVEPPTYNLGYLTNEFDSGIHNLYRFYCAQY